MLSTRSLKRKIRSVKNTEQLTDAMEMVAASKMRKSQLVALNSRPYCEKALEVLGELGERVKFQNHPLLKRRYINKVALLVIASDKGLCGGLNANVLEKAQQFLDRKGRGADIIVIGKKAKEYLIRRGYNVIAEFSDVGDSVEIEETLSIANLMMDLYTSKKYDLIMAVYTNFISTLKQKAVLRQVLPISIGGIKEVVKNISTIPIEEKDKTPLKYNYSFKLEPSVNEVLNELIPDFLEIQTYHMVLESNASEHSARMVAMKNASDSASDLIDKFTLTFNKLRQAAITREITDITAGSEALNH